MKLIDMGTFPVTLMVSLSVAVVLLIIRVAVMQRVQNQRQRENRQETERLKSLAAAYRALAGSFTPAEVGDRRQLEEALSDIILFGDKTLVELGARAANDLVRTGSADLGPLVEELRIDLRAQLGLEPYPEGLVIPASGPGRANRGNDEGGGRRGSGWRWRRRRRRWWWWRCWTGRCCDRRGRGPRPLRSRQFGGARLTALS